MVVLLQAQLVAPQVALQGVLVEEDLLPTQETPVEGLEEEVPRRRLHVLEELRGEDPMVRPHVTVEPPLLGKDSLTADKPNEIFL